MTHVSTRSCDLNRAQQDGTNSYFLIKSLRQLFKCWPFYYSQWDVHLFEVLQWSQSARVITLFTTFLGHHIVINKLDAVNPGYDKYLHIIIRCVTVCVYACVCVYMRVCMLVCVCVCMCVYGYVHAYAYMCMHMCVWACVCVRMCVYVWCVHVNLKKDTSITHQLLII